MRTKFPFAPISVAVLLAAPQALGDSTNPTYATDTDQGAHVTVGVSGVAASGFGDTTLDGIQASIQYQSRVNRGWSEVLDGHPRIELNASGGVVTGLPGTGQGPEALGYGSVRMVPSDQTGAGAIAAIQGGCDTLTTCEGAFGLGIRPAWGTGNLEVLFALGGVLDRTNGVYSWVTPAGLDLKLTQNLGERVTLSAALASHLTAGEGNIHGESNAGVPFADVGALTTAKLGLWVKVAGPLSLGANLRATDNYYKMYYSKGPAVPWNQLDPPIDNHSLSAQATVDANVHF